jgi:class 3 adenylate cyclase
VAAVFARAAGSRGSDRRSSALERQRWADGVDLRVRMASTGEAEERDDDYFGPEVNRAAG